MDEQLNAEAIFQQPETKFETTMFTCGCFVRHAVRSLLMLVAADPSNADLRWHEERGWLMSRFIVTAPRETIEVIRAGFVAIKQKKTPSCLKGFERW